MRRRDSPSGVEFRRRSFLVTPDLDRPRRELLQQEFNVIHLPMTTAEFAGELLGLLDSAPAEGFALLRATTAEQAPETSLPVVSVISRGEPADEADYLLGRAPRWGELAAGRAIRREADDELERAVKELLSDDGARPVVLITGTAGSGKSTACMRLALSIVASGQEVAWADNDVEIAPVHIRRSMESPGHPPVLLVDDADRYGNTMPDLAAEIVRGADHPLVILSARSGRVDRLADRLRVLGVPIREWSCPRSVDG